VADPQPARVSLRCLLAVVVGLAQHVGADQEVRLDGEFLQQGDEGAVGEIGELATRIEGSGVVGPGSQGPE
jgi:hypothetical protein